MESKVSYTLVGLFVIVLGLALVIVTLWLAGGWGERMYDTYRVYVRESVSGLNPRSAVRYRGVEVGQVASIRLDPDDPRRVIVTLQIEQGTPIREDTTATLTIQGLTGLATVELSGGSPWSPPLTAAEGEPYPVIRSLPSLVQRLDNAFNDALEVMQQLSTDLGVLLSPANQQAVAGILANLNTISATVAGESATIESTLVNLDTVTGAVAAQADAIDRALAHLAITLEAGAEASVGVNQLLTQLGTSVATVDAMAQSITATSRSVDQAVVASQRELSQIVQRSGPELNALLLEMNQLTDAVQRFMQVLERDPQILLFGRPSERPGPGEQGR
jgi:phospholipid/cholesterol/gamma-HCH transport system substrate-binding protein